MRRSVTIIAFALIVTALPSSAQIIFEPEGLNIPGAYDSFINPPSVEALRSVNNNSGEVAPDLSLGTRTYKSGVFQAAAVDGQVAPGTYNWLYTSGPGDGLFNNKWADVTVTMNMVQNYIWQGNNDNSITFAEGNYYLTRFLDSGYGNTDAIWFELSAPPVDFITVVDNMGTRTAGDDVLVTATMNADPALSGEIVYIRYTEDDFATSTVAAMSCVAVVCTFDVPASVPDNTDGGEFYYLFTSTANPAADGSDADIKTITVANNSGNNYALPVELTAFTATLDGSAATLAWATASETNNDGFSVERFVAGGFEQIGFVPGAGTTLEAQSYTFTARDLEPGTHRFRLKQTDYDGAFSYSPEVEVTVGMEGAYALSSAYPNPFGASTQMSLSVKAAQEVEVAAYDVLGRRVATLFLGAMEAGASRALTLDAAPLAAGLYVIRAEGETFSATRTVTVVR
jgi:hypothetical protein